MELEDFQQIKEKIVNIAFDKPTAAANFDYVSFSGDAVALLEDKRFNDLEPSERGRLFSQIHQIYGAFWHRSGLDVIPSASLRLKDLASEKELHLDSLCAAYDLLYFLYWCWANAIDDQKAFGEDVVLPFSQAIRAAMSISAGASPRSSQLWRRPKVGILAQFSSVGPGNAVANVNSLVMRSLRANGFDVTLFAWMFHDDATSRIFQDQGITVRRITANSMTERIDLTAEAVRADAPDVLLTDMNTALPTVLFERRIAPVQIFYQLGMPYWPVSNLDAVFRAWSFKPDHAGFVGVPSTVLQGPFNLPEYNQEREPAIVAQERSFFPATRLIGYYGRLSKITPEYVSAIAAIIDGIDNVTVIIGGTGDGAAIKKYISQTGLEERIIVIERYVDGQIWGQFIDVFLDTFPLPGGASVMEMTAKGKPTVSMSVPDLKNFDKLKASNLIAFDLESYVKIARQLLLDVVFYKRMCEATVALSQSRPNEKDYGKAISTAIIKTFLRTRLKSVIRRR